MKSVREWAAEYLENKWKLCRIQPGSKGPRDLKWNEVGHEIRTPDAFPIGYGVGLLHAYSGTMALDIDNYPVARAWLAERGVDLDALLGADDAVQIVSGRVDRAKLLYQCTPRPGAACAEYPAVDSAGKPRRALALDFRCATAGGNSQQDALPPTIHPTRAVPYAWRFGLFGDWRTLPLLPTALADIWDTLRAPIEAAAVTVAVPSGAAPTEVQRWLDTQDPGMCRTDWVVVGMKLHAEFQGSAAGFEIWQRWSSRSSKWDDEARTTMYPIWKGFRLEGRALATLETDLRTMPADAAEFENVAPAVAEFVAEQTTVGDPAPGEMPDHEYVWQREIRAILQDYVVLQTGGSKPYFLMPGHPRKSVHDAAGMAGAEKTPFQLQNIFGPYMPMIPKGKQSVKADPAEQIMNAKWRQECHRVGFRPGGDEFYREGDGHVYLNAFRAIQIEPVKPTPHQIEPLLWLLRRVVAEEDGQPVFVQWLLRLYAHVLRNPSAKVRWAPLLYSKTPGTGKTTLMETIPKLLFGDQYARPMTHSVLRERFAGAEFEAMWWCCLTEMKSDVGKIDARAIANKMKPWITDDKIQIEKKGVDSYAIYNHLQFTATSNHRDALFLEEGEKERRWLVGQMCEDALTTAEKSMLNPLFGTATLRDPLAQSWLHWFFLHGVDLTGFNPDESPPETTAKRLMSGESNSVWEDEVLDAKHVNAPPFDKDLILPTQITKELLIGHRLSTSQAKTLLEKAGCVPLKGAFNFARSIYCQKNYDQWIAMSHHQIHAYIRGGARPFKEVDDCADLL